jgi:triphosphoribosyl-dephospho-CoA synthase
VTAAAPLPAPERARPRERGPRSAPRAIGRAAIDALREELRVSPKPGLVTPRDAGAHADMDHATFLAGIGALRDAFPAIARAAMAGAPFDVLRELGVRAEARMLAATRGVNTHRGAIFMLGLLSAAAGRLAADGAPPEPRALRETIHRVYGPGIVRELPPAAGTHGAVVAARHRVGGARAEAAAGLPHLFDVAFPALVASLARGASRRAAAVECLMSAIAVLPDTNLLYRGGAAGLAFARSSAAAFLRSGGVHRTGWEDHASEIHAAFVARRLSPGGSADLLAASLAVLRLAHGGAAATGDA